MREANFSAFYRNKRSYREASDSSIDFRFRNMEKWIEERKAVKSVPVPIPDPVTPNMSETINKKNIHRVPPGLTKVDDIHIPSYDDFLYDENSTKDEPIWSVDLLPPNWQIIKSLHNIKDIRLAGYNLPPHIEIGDCDNNNDDLPLNMYEAGDIALDALPFTDNTQRDFYMNIFCTYFNLLNNACGALRTQ